MPSDQPATQDLAAQHLAAITGFRLTTRDLPGMRRFCLDALGFTPDGPEHPIAKDELRLLGLAGTGRRQTLRLDRQTVAIDQFDPPGRSYPAGGDAASLWFQHLAIVVPDMMAAFQRLRDAAPISVGGPQRLPAPSGGVRAFKFRGPDGHPFELLEFPAGASPPAWVGLTASPGQTAIGIDHSAISVSDAKASVAFYAALGLRAGPQTINQGPEQQRLDGLAQAKVVVAPMLPDAGTPHLELLDYDVARDGRRPAMQPNDVGATRIVWRGARSALLRDPDGHLHQVEAASPERCA